ncbi:uncharacterized protein LOC106074802 [Biomphalaria glabrata]|uniref:Uncharacterized protein LOC106074802 n=1 Tax=Biomphalaria glabrata TaxID=6526 RepID=A0A9U8EK55_BIOGL|nr:uncharacterized protein LOC106074802 [Biomphalaria glabrata]
MNESKEEDVPLYLNSQDTSDLSLVSLVFSLVNNSCISSAIGLFGMVANVMNMLVFYKQGLSSSINISFFFMSVSDMLTIIFVEWGNICYNPYILKAGFPLSFPELYYIAGGWPSGLSCRITLYITVYITAERCLCILFPLTIKTLVTPRKTKSIIALINFLNALTLIPEYTSTYLAWRFNPLRNTTILGLAFRGNRAETQGVSFLLHVILVVFGLCSVIVLTSVLVIQLRRQTKWRLKNRAENSKLSLLSSRDRKSVVLVIAVATFVVISYIPLTSVSLVTVFVPEFYIEGKLYKVFGETWAMVTLIGMTNASANIIIYYKMNSKYRPTFHEIFCKK